MWIRSQDRLTLVKSERLIISCPNENFEGSGKYARVLNYKAQIGNTEDYDVLGVYETKERAIEVVNDMQEHLTAIGIINVQKHNNLVSFFNKDILEKIIFQMPEE